MGILQRLFGKDEPKYQPGAMLTGEMIQREYDAGRIMITEFKKENLNPNSYNITIGDQFSMYKDITHIDLKNKETYSETEVYKISDEGVILRPGNLYLIPTKEIIMTEHYIPLITGRSSIGRLGIAVHQEAGFGDIGYSGIWTMQVKVTYPTKIYPHIQIGQVYFLTPHGPVGTLYTGKYQGSAGATASRWSL